MWGFTVDDALIPVRYARHLAAGEGYRFDVPGPVTDGVTPLPWAFVLAPIARGEALDVLARAKLLGLVAWVGAAAALGAAIGRAPGSRTAKATAFLAIALCVPLSAHSASGMETGLAIGLATLAAISMECPLRAAVFAGLAASLRPEMAPWAVVVGGGLAALRSGRHDEIIMAPRRRRAEVAVALALAMAPFVLCALVRLVVFGRAAPLSVLAKPGDPTQGGWYAVSAALVSGGPILAFAGLARRRAPPAAYVLGGAGLVHLVAVAFAGGDWMPFARLVAPIVPSLVYASVLATPSRLGDAARGLVALGLEAYVVVFVAPTRRHTMQDRAALVEAARPVLTGARTVASLDAGWPTAVTEAPIVDLAGVTDPEIAALPGGHTSKRVDPPLLLARDPDVLLLYARTGLDPANLAAWPGATYERLLEVRLARAELVQTHFTPRAFLPLGASGAGYVVLARVREP
jgi:hypothetical protein